MENDVKRELRNGFVVSFFSNYVGVILQIIMGMILSRILSPKEYGVVSIVFILTSFFSVLGNMGLYTAVIQKDLNQIELITLFYFSLLISIILSVIIYNSGILISAFFNNEEYIKIMRWLSLSLFFNVLVMIPSAIIRKKKEFLKIGIIETIANLVSGVFSIIFALKGFSYYSLIYSSIINSFINFLIKFYFCKIKFFLKFELTSLKEIVKYSFFQMMTNLFNFITGNADNIIIGKFMGEINLGLYDKAYKLMRYPVISFANIISPVLHPILATHKNNPEIIYEAFIKMMKSLIYIGVTISVFVYFSSYDIIYVMYGEKWINSSPILKMLGLTIWVNLCFGIYGSILQSLDRTDIMFYGNIGSFFITSIALISSMILKFQLKDIALCISLSFFINFLLCFYLMIIYGFKKKFYLFLYEFKNQYLYTVILIFFINLFKNHNFINSYMKIFLNFTIVFAILILFLWKKEKKLIGGINGR